MILMDVNILVYAHREDTPDHPAYRDWVEGTINRRSAYGVSELVLSGFMRVVIHPKVFERPTPLAVALEVVKQIRGQPHAISLRPGPRHWTMAAKLLRASDAIGNLIPDAYHAALAIASGGDWITTDKGFYASHASVYWAGRVYPLTVAHDAFYPSSAVVIADS